MPKQEEIRERLAFVFTNTGYPIGYDAADEILFYLHSQGVVIKVDKELPDILSKTGWASSEGRSPLEVDMMRTGAKVMSNAMLKAGFVSVEPLREIASDYQG